VKLKADSISTYIHIATQHKMARKALANDQIVKLIVGAGQASPSPPVGPALGSKGVKSMDFCKVHYLILALYRCLLLTISPPRNSTPAQQTTSPAHQSQPASQSAPIAASTSRSAHHPPHNYSSPQQASKPPRTRSAAPAT